MKKRIIILGVLILIAAVIYMLATGKEASDVPQADQDVSEEVMGEDREVRGTIVSVNTDHVPVDGPVLVTIRQEDGTETLVTVLSMGINLCAAQANIADAFALESGEEVEVRGSVDAEGAITPCESADHYLRVAGE